MTEATEDRSISSGKLWSERDLLILYAGLSMGTGISDIAASVNRTEEEIVRKAATLKSELWKPDA